MLVASPYAHVPKVLGVPLARVELVIDGRAVRGASAELPRARPVATRQPQCGLRFGAQVDCVLSVLLAVRNNVRDDGLAIGGELRAVVAVAFYIRNVLAVEPNQILAVQVLNGFGVNGAIFEAAGIVIFGFREIDWAVPHVHILIGAPVQQHTLRGRSRSRTSRIRACRAFCAGSRGSASTGGCIGARVGRGPSCVGARATGSRESHGKHDGCAQGNPSLAIVHHS